MPCDADPLAMPEVVAVNEIDWAAVRSVMDPLPIRARMPAIVQQMAALLDRPDGPGMLFDSSRATVADRVVYVPAIDDAPLWIIGDLHGDLLALEAALAHIRRTAVTEASPAPRLIFLGDFFDDEGLAIEVLLRVFELILESPEHVCVLVGNHDEALSHDGARFCSNVSPSDFADFLNARLTDDGMVQTGKLAMRLTAHAACALFLPNGLLVAHGGFPLVDLHAKLAATGDWNDPACLSDFVWARAHPKARRKLPNRYARGSQFGYEDFAEFCALSAQLGRPVTHFVRGHDHVEERYAIYPAYQAHPLLTTVALSRRLPRESFGTYERAPTVARVVHGSLPQVYQMHPPADLIRQVFPEKTPSGDLGESGAEPDRTAMP